MALPNVLVKSLISRAIKGDSAAVKLLMPYIEKLPPAAFAEFHRTQADEKLLEEFVRRAKEYVSAASTALWAACISFIDGRSLSGEMWINTPNLTQDRPPDREARLVKCLVH
jgi:hypothetical protein